MNIQDIINDVEERDATVLNFEKLDRLVQYIYALEVLGDAADEIVAEARNGKVSREAIETYESERAEVVGVLQN